MRVIYGLGRAIFGGFFLYNGINHFRQSKALAGYAAAKQIPNPDLSVKASGVLLTAAGASLLLGLKPKAGALGVIGFLAVSSVLFHDFWNKEDPQQKQGDLVHFSKNLALAAAAAAMLGSE
ncbi:MAG TPA: DoxX family protein [Acidobacteriaceae bacterium]|jgi:uncharacterized membrane protein YphA (DoxX/SURF4 family)